VLGRNPSDVEVGVSYDAHGGGVGLVLANRGRVARLATAKDAYSNREFVQVLAPGESVGKYWSLNESFGWYDVTVAVEGDSTFLCHLAGHVETGKDSASDPAIGAERRHHAGF
jgi:phospholipase C